MNSLRRKFVVGRTDDGAERSEFVARIASWDGIVCEHSSATQRHVWLLLVLSWATTDTYEARPLLRVIAFL